MYKLKDKELSGNDDIISLIIDSKIFTIIGASEKKDSISYSISKNLIGMNKIVNLVNPKYEYIDDKKVFKDLSAIEEIGVVILMVNPLISITYIEQLKESGVKYIWAQPGTLDKKLAKKLLKLDIMIVDACILSTISIYDLRDN